MATYPIKMLRDEDRQPFIPFTNAAAVVDKDNKTLQELMDNGKYKIINNVTTTSAGKGVLDAYQGKVLKDNFNNYVPLSQKGVANGVATLDGEGKVPSAQLPSYVDDVLETYIRTGTTALAADWLSLTDGGAALTPEKGKIYLVMTTGSYQNKQYRWGGSTYVLCNPSDVNSVNGMTGVVVLKDLTIQKNGTKVGDAYNGGAAKTINITVPTKVSDITNDTGFITASDNITGNAATATKATQDGDGNTITSTYVKKAGDTMTGALIIKNDTHPQLTIQSGSTEAGIYLYRTNADTNISWKIVDRSGPLYFESKTKADTTFNTALEIHNSDTNSLNPGANNVMDLGTSSKKWKNVYATTFNGNATSATKATQDGSGNIITSTYVKKSGDTMTGDLNISTGNLNVANGYISGQPISDTQHNHAIKMGHSGDNVMNFYEYGGVFNFYESNSNVDTLLGSITSEGWVGNVKGNASSATKVANQLTIQKNGSTVVTFDGSQAKTANITVPTKLSELTNDGNYVKTTDYASTTAAGVIKLGTGLAIKDGIVSVTGSATADSVEWAAVKNAPTKVSYWTNDSGYLTAANTMTGATASTAGKAGVVPAPASGDQAKYLRGDGQWATVAEATKATQDGNGNTITSTYVKKAGDTMSGDLNFSHTGSGKPAYIHWNSGGYRQRIRVDDESTDNHAVFTFQESADSGATYKRLLEIRNNGRLVTDGAMYIGHAVASEAIIYLNNKQAIKGTDNWLRLNEEKHFTSGIYCGTGILRTDGNFYLGSESYLKYNATNKCIEFNFV